MQKIFSFFNDCKVARSHVNIGGGEQEHQPHKTHIGKYTNMRRLSTCSDTNQLTCGHSNRSDYLLIRICLLQQKPAFQGSFWAHICLRVSRNHHI